MGKREDVVVWQVEEGKLWMFWTTVYKNNFNAKCCTKRQLFLEEARVREEGGTQYVSMSITDILNRSLFICLMLRGCLTQLFAGHLKYKGAAILHISARIWNTIADRRCEGSKKKSALQLLAAVPSFLSPPAPSFLYSPRTWMTKLPTSVTESFTIVINVKDAA